MRSSPVAKALEPREAWVLSLLDEPLSIDDLLDVTGFQRAALIAILERLIRLGYVASDRFRSG